MGRQVVDGGWRGRRTSGERAENERRTSRDGADGAGERAEMGLTGQENERRTSGERAENERR